MNILNKKLINISLATMLSFTFIPTLQAIDKESAKFWKSNSRKNWVREKKQANKKFTALYEKFIKKVKKNKQKAVIEEVGLEWNDKKLTDYVKFNKKFGAAMDQLHKEEKRWVKGMTVLTASKPPKDIMDVFKNELYLKAFIQHSIKGFYDNELLFIMSTDAKYGGKKILNAEDLFYKYVICPDIIRKIQGVDQENNNTALFDALKYKESKKTHINIYDGPQKNWTAAYIAGFDDKNLNKQAIESSIKDMWKSISQKYTEFYNQFSEANSKQNAKKVAIDAQKRVVYKIMKTYRKRIQKFQKEIEKEAKKKKIKITKKEDFARGLLNYLNSIERYCTK